jgi:hypothetical protein
LALKSPHKEWRVPQASILDARAVGLDELLARLWLRVLHENRPLIRRAVATQTISELANEMSRPNNHSFRGFVDVPAAAEAWLRADLVKPLRRSPQFFSVARPVHSVATRIRSSKGADDSLASHLVYGWLKHTDERLIDDLRRFVTVQPDEEESLDLASYALLLLGEEHEDDIRAQDSESPPVPQCFVHAANYADDLRRLLAYAPVMPRAALVDHIRRLTGLYVGLSLLRTFWIVVDVEQRGGETRTCAACAAGEPPADGQCPYRLELVVDCGEEARSATARIAEASWARHEDRLARYVRSHLALRKLDEFAAILATEDPDRAVPHMTLEEIAAVEHTAPRERLDAHFGERIRLLVEEVGEGAKERTRELERDYRAMGRSAFRIYVALLAHFSERRWVSYHRQLVDSLLAKNSADGALRQPLGGPRRRRPSLGPGLLETLTLAAVVDISGEQPITRPLRVDRLIRRLEERYDLVVSRPPTELGADPGSFVAMADNVVRFKSRLREIGLYTDLSDAFLAQTIKPRHRLERRDT